MDLPVFRKGLELVSAQLNKLSQGIRAAQVTSVIGGSFTRTPAGTTIVIAPQSSGGGGGSAAAAYCPFKVTDVSEQGKLFIEIQQDKIQGRYPVSMNGTGTFIREIPSEWISGGIVWVGVYIIIKVNEFGQIREPEDSIRVELSYRPLDNYGANQVFLISEITISTDSANGHYISDIANACPLITVQNNGFCPFEVSDVFAEVDSELKIQIQNNKIKGRIPDGMQGGGIYELNIPNDGEWHAVYCILAVDGNGNILPGDTSISFSIFNNYQQNTSEIQYVLIGEVSTSYDGLSKRYISFIQNVCIIPDSEKASACWYRVTTYDDNSVEVAQMPLPTNNPGLPYIWPVGMPSGRYILNVPNTGYIYLGVQFDINYYIVSPAADSVYIFYSENLLANTISIQYILLAVVFINNNKISNIFNVCSQPAISPCLLTFIT